MRLKKIDTSGLAELVKYKDAAKALGLSVRQVKKYVASGRLLTKGHGSHKLITKASLVSYASQRSKPAPVLTPAARAERRYRNRDEREAAYIYRCALEFMQGYRAPADWSPQSTAVKAGPATAKTSPVSAVPENRCQPGCRCIRHG